MEKKIIIVAGLLLIYLCLCGIASWQITHSQELKTMEEAFRLEATNPDFVKKIDGVFGPSWVAEYGDRLRNLVGNRKEFLSSYHCWDSCLWLVPLLESGNEKIKTSIRSFAICWWPFKWWNKPKVSSPLTIC